MNICETEPKHEFEFIRFNYSKNSDFVDFLVNITRHSQMRWFNERISSWQDDHFAKYVEALTLNGIAFTFNTFSANKTFNMNT